jgi:hypothetical protein
MAVSHVRARARACARTSHHRLKVSGLNMKNYSHWEAPEAVETLLRMG